MKSYITVSKKPSLGEPSKAGSYRALCKSKVPLALLCLNLLGAVAHASGVILVRSRARTTFKLNVWNHLLINRGNMSHPAWDLDLEVFTIHPKTVITTFFSLSLAFHMAISLVLVSYQFYPEQWWNRWYLWGIYHNLAPWRWCEYALSAPIMLLLTAPMVGVRQLYTIWAVVGLIGITMLFGWMTELHASFFIESEPSAEPYAFCGWELVRRWCPGSWKHRLQFHVMGYLPYALCWTIVFDRFRLNMLSVSDIVPEFVNSTVIGSASLFTLFGVTSALHQALPYGPSLYWLGEISYVVLSFAAKAQLGFIVLFQALAEGAVYDKVLEIDFKATIE